MLDFFIQVQQSSGGGGGSALTFNGDGDPPETPTHLIYFPSSDNAADRIEIWDVSTPTSCTKITSWNCGINYAYSAAGSFANDRGACVKNGTCYFLAKGDGIYSLDVSDPTTLGASQVLDNLPQSAFPSTYFQRFIAAHPTKDLLWVGGFDGKVSTIDISNPASMSIIGTVQSTPTTPHAYRMSKDGEVCYVLDNGNLYRFELNASNQPSNETTITTGWASTSVESLTWTENALGEAFLARCSFLDDISIAEIDSSYGVTSSYTYTNASNYDYGQAICGMPYVTNYSSDDIGVVVWNRDDYSLSIGTVDTSTNTITHRVESAQDAIWITQYVYDMESFDQYVFVLMDGKMSVWQWSSLNALTQAQTMAYGSGANQVNTGTSHMCLFKP